MREMILLALCNLFQLELTDAVGLSLRAHGRTFAPQLKLTFKADACEDGLRGPFRLMSQKDYGWVNMSQQTANELFQIGCRGKWWQYEAGVDNRSFVIQLTQQFHFGDGSAEAFVSDFADTLEAIEVITSHDANYTSCC